MRKGTKAEKALEIFNKNGKASLSEKITALLRMFKAVFSGFYKVSKIRLLFLSLGLGYIILPFDFDWIPFIGWIDDMMVLGYLVKNIGEEIEKFISWETKNINS